MNNLKKIIKILILFIGVSILFVFQNCAKTIVGDGFQLQNNYQAYSSLSENQFSNNSEDNQSDSDNASRTQPRVIPPSPVNPPSGTENVCDDKLLTDFQIGYYNFLKTNCSTCHNGKIEAPAFAADDLLQSFQVFKSKGADKISNFAINPNHSKGFTGAQHVNAIGKLKAEWIFAQEDYLKCKGDKEVDNSVITANKTNTTIVANKMKLTLWNKTVWNLSAATDMPPKGLKFPLKISIDAQIAKYNNVEVGYVFKNPVLSLLSGANKYRVKGIFFYVNNKFIPSATGYSNLDVVVCPGAGVTAAPIGNAQLVVVPKVLATDKFALQFSSIEKVDSSTPCSNGSKTAQPTIKIPARVTFAQLIGSDATLNVFKSKCLSCHSSTSSNGGLDLSNYAKAKSKGVAIIRRINDSASPMPTSGLMNTLNRALVEKWVSLGMPEK